MTLESILYVVLVIIGFLALTAFSLVIAAWLRAGKSQRDFARRLDKRMDDYRAEKKKRMGGA